MSLLIGFAWVKKFLLKGPTNIQIRVGHKLKSIQLKMWFFYRNAWKPSTNWKEKMHTYICLLIRLWNIAIRTKCISTFYFPRQYHRLNIMEMDLLSRVTIRTGTSSDTMGLILGPWLMQPDPALSLSLLSNVVIKYCLCYHLLSLCVHSDSWCFITLSRKYWY